MTPPRDIERTAPAGEFSVAGPILVACGLTLLLYLGAYMRLPLVPLFASRLGATTVQVGLINAGFMLAATLLSFPLGLVSDRLGRRRLILAGIVFSALTSLFLSLARSPAQVGAIYLFSGIGLACFSPAMMSFVGDVSPPQFLGRSYGWYTAALYLGMAAGPGIGGAVAIFGFRSAFLLSAAVIAVAALAGGLRLPSAPVVIRPKASSLRLDLREIVSNPAVVACWIATFFSTFAWGSLFAFFPLYARDMGISVVHTGLIFTSQAAANAIFRIPVGHLADRTGRRERYILFGNLIFSLAIAVVGLFR
ncbi:MAG TPA: MFS transporter, partial [Gemmatimonadales bacterium]|nr:MFS transporter [Gemmatimonadales bacterium]